MIANYHCHTPSCRHAVGTEKEYIENAIERGLEILGFSDHTPQWFPGSYYSRMRMYPKQLPEYCKTIRKLQEKYTKQIQLHLGLEVEYYPALFSDLLPRLRDQGVEYILLGQHWVENEENAPYSGTPTNDESLLRRYCDQVIEAMQTGVFTYLAHPDLVQFLGDPKIYDQHMRRLCKAAKDTNTPLEINFLGMVEGRHYPTDALWQIVGEEGCKVVLGIDAHTPDQILDPMPEERALRMVRQYGLNLLETVPLKKI